MKSSFLLTLVLCSVMSMSVFGQTKKSSKTVRPSNAATAVPTPSETAVSKTTTVTESVPTEEKSAFDKFYDRLKIGYYGAITTPTFHDMGNNDWQNAAVSPSLGGPDGTPNGPKKNQDTWPTNVWNQVGFRYNFGAKMDFVFNPRFMIPLASPTDMKAPEDRSFIEIEDFLVGFQGVPYTSEDKKFNLWIRPGVRLPTSRPGRNAGNAGFGQLTYQPELAYNPTYDFNTKWQIGIFGQFRLWVFENRFNPSRFRFYTAPTVMYTINDTTRIQAYYQTIIENNKRWETINGKKPIFKDYYQDIILGVNKDVTKKLNIYPFIGMFIDDIPITDRSFYLGAWVSYQIK